MEIDVEADFSEVLRALKKGRKARRSCWIDGDFICYYSPVKEHPLYADSFPTSHGDYPLRPFFLAVIDGCFSPWFADEADLYAEDWEILY